jgi:hypothetical protein
LSVDAAQRLNPLLRALQADDLDAASIEVVAAVGAQRAQAFEDEELRNR